MSKNPEKVSPVEGCNSCGEPVTHINQTGVGYCSTHASMAKQAGDVISLKPKDV